MSDERRRWIDAAIAFSRNRDARVACPRCRGGELQLTEVVASTGRGELWMACGSCRATNALLNTNREQRAVERTNYATENGTKPTSGPTKPGSSWRVEARLGENKFVVSDHGTFDELVVDQWLHIEQLGDRTWWMKVGDVRLEVEILADGKASVSVHRGE